MDGNKRLAVAALETFLMLNDASLVATDDEVRDFALGVADGTISQSQCLRFVRARCARAHWQASQITKWADNLDPDEFDQIRQALEAYGPFGRAGRLREPLRKIVREFRDGLSREH